MKNNRKKWDESYRRKNTLAIREQGRKWRLRNKQKEKKRQKEKYLRYKREKPEIFKKWSDKFSKTPKGKMKSYKRNAKDRGIDFNISLEEFTSFWKKRCHYCSGEIEYIGLDRIDNTKGYEKGNIIPCCFKCNYMKRNWTVYEFISHCHKVVRRYSKKD